MRFICYFLRAVWTNQNSFEPRPARRWAPGLIEATLLVVLCACKLSSEEQEAPEPTPAAPAAPPQIASPEVAPSPGPPAAPGTTATSPAFRVQPSAGVKLVETTRHYDIDGQSGQDLRRELNRKRPKDSKGDRHDAVTSYYVRWSYPFDRKRARCGLGKVSVQVEVKYTLPRWRGTSGAPAKLVRGWKRYESALTEHEYKHRDFGVRAGNEIYRTLSASKPRGSCPVADKNANAMASQILKRHVAREREYDRRTRHGASEGALFF